MTVSFKIFEVEQILIRPLNYYLLSYYIVNINIEKCHQVRNRDTFQKRPSVQLRLLVA